MALFTMGTGGNYITMLPADWSISRWHDPWPPVDIVKRCYGIRLYPLGIQSHQPIQCITMWRTLVSDLGNRWTLTWFFQTAHIPGVSLHVHVYAFVTGGH